MAKKYEVDGKYFLPVTVFTTDARSINPIGVQYVFAGNGNKGTTYLDDCPDLLLTAEEIYASRQTADKIEYLTDMLDYGRKKYDEIEELKSRNEELEALLKEVMETRDEAIKQNDELIAENKRLGEENLRLRNKAIERTTYADNLMKENEGLKGDCNEWKDAVDKRIIDIQTITAERDNLKADLTTQKEVNEELKAKIAELTAWYEEANKTASEAAEANDELKAKIAELRDEVATLKAERCSLNGQAGKNLAEIQALSSDVHFFKEACKKQKAECDELKGRYDELDSVNHEQAEKIRDLDKTVAKLKDENTNLSFLLEDQPEKEVTKPLHVVLNDGTEIEFRRYTAYDYHTDINMFVVKDGEKYIAGFLRGDKPMNLAYWWTE